MKLTWISGAGAAALALTSGLAQAQSRVTLYGVVDANVEHVTNLSRLNPREAGFPGPPTSRTSMRSGGLTGSQIGFSGVEDLGNGNKVLFTLESGIDLRDGTPQQGGRAYGRQAFVGLESRYGRLMLGRQYTSIFEALYRFSPTVYATQFEPIIFLTGMNFRSDNTIKYAGNFGKLGVLAHWTFKSGVFGAGQAKPDEPFQRDSGYGAALTYTDGPLNATVAYDRANPVMALFGDDGHGESHKLAASVSYQAGPLKLIGGYRWEKGQYSNGEDFIRDDLWWLGANYLANPQWGFTAAYYYLDLSKLKRNFTAQASDPRNPWQLTLMANHYLSKRTEIYFTAAYARHAGLNFDTSPIGFANGYFLGAGKNSMAGYALGIRHRF